MSIRCFIGKLNESTNLVDYVYCHGNGHIEEVGKILNEYYNESNKIQQLLNYGDMRFLGETIEKSFFYMRDCNEKDCGVKQKVYPDFKRLDEILYLFKNNEWFMINRNELISVKAYYENKEN